MKKEEFELLTQDEDEAEHSCEMMLPYLAHVISHTFSWGVLQAELRFMKYRLIFPLCPEQLFSQLPDVRVVPIMVGNTSPRRDGEYAHVWLCLFKDTLNW